MFGGNFLHSFAIEKQLRIAQIEELTKVPTKYRFAVEFSLFLCDMLSWCRFPFFTELLWYALDKYVWALMGKTHLKVEEDVMVELYGEKWERQEHQLSIGHIHITPQELFGLKAIVMFIHALPVTRKSVPPLLQDAVSLIKDIRTIVDSHKDDILERSLTGKPLLYWPGRSEKKWNRQKTPVKRDVRGDTVEPREPAARTPCTACRGCKTRACNNCDSCRSLPRQRCIMRSCHQPVLDPTTVCVLCHLDGWYASPHMSLIDRPAETNSLMECSTCLRVVHPGCETDYGVEGVIRSDLPNLWYCPKCMKYQPPSEEEILAAKSVKLEAEEKEKVEDQLEVRGTSDQSKIELRVQLAEKIMSASNKQLKQPSFVFRPPPHIVKAEEVYERIKKKSKTDPVELSKEPLLLLPVFQYLTTSELAKAAR